MQPGWTSGQRRGRRRCVGVVQSRAGEEKWEARARRQVEGSLGVGRVVWETRQMLWRAGTPFVAERGVESRDGGVGGQTDARVHVLQPPKRGQRCVRGTTGFALLAARVYSFAHLVITKNLGWKIKQK